MATTPTLNGAELRYGQPDNLEASVVKQLRAMRDTWGDKKRPYVITLYVYEENVLVFAGHPAGKVRE